MCYSVKGQCHMVILTSQVSPKGCRQLCNSLNSRHSVHGHMAVVCVHAQQIYVIESIVYSASSLSVVAPGKFIMLTGDR